MPHIAMFCDPLPTLDFTHILKWLHPYTFAPQISHYILIIKPTRCTDFSNLFLE